MLNHARIKYVRENLRNNPYHTNGIYPGFEDSCDETYVAQMRQLGVKYRNVRYLPLDIPKFELPDYDEFVEFWDRESVPNLRIRPDTAEPWQPQDHPLGDKSSWVVPSFRSLYVWAAPWAGLEQHPFTTKVFRGRFHQFDRIKEFVIEHFPLQISISFFIWESLQDINPHQDLTATWNCPTDFRMMLHDNNDEPTLYTSDIELGDTHMIELPPDTNSFCWSNGSQIHGSVYRGRRKFLLFIAGVQHPQRSDELFERSYLKYRNALNYNLQIPEIDAKLSTNS